MNDIEICSYAKICIYISCFKSMSLPWLHKIVTDKLWCCLCHPWNQYDSHLKTNEAEWMSLWDSAFICSWLAAIIDWNWLITLSALMPLYSHGLTLIPVWISTYIHYKVWDEIDYSFWNFNGAAVEVWEWISNFILHINGHVITYPCCD